MPSSSAQVVTPLREGDTVTWRTGTGFRTGGELVALLDEKTARVRVAAGKHSSFGLVTIGLAKLERADAR